MTFNLIAGIGALIYDTNYDALDADGNTYDFSSIDALPDAYGDRKDRQDALAELLDGEYETEGEFNDSKPSLGDNPIRPNINFGLGVQFRVHKRISIDLEHLVTATFDDLLDGQKWDTPFTRTSNNDVLHYTSLGVSVSLGGKSDEPSWFVNPLEFAYNEIKLNKPPDMSDNDGDGVIDILDKELDTPEGFAVDPRGVTLDSDKDGYPDSEDPEPFSSPNYPIEDGQNILPETVTKDEVAQMIEDRLNQYTSTTGGAGSNWYLPMINFDLNRDKIKTEFYDELKHVAEVMTAYPSLNVEVIGHTDVTASEDYNSDLSRRRAENSVNFLSSEYGIAQSRFVIRYEGESNVLVKNAGSNNAHYMNRRVEFKPITK